MFFTNCMSLSLRFSSRFTAFSIDLTWPEWLLSRFPHCQSQNATCDTHTHTQTCTLVLLWVIWPKAMQCATCMCVCVWMCVFCPLQMYVLWFISVIHPKVPKTHSPSFSLFLSLFHTHLLSSVPQIVPDIFPIILQYQEVNPCRGPDWHLGTAL